MYILKGSMTTLLFLLLPSLVLVPWGKSCLIQR
jgi:hypothetical protein